jgi:hypothetical protein
VRLDGFKGPVVQSVGWATIQSCSAAGTGTSYLGSWLRSRVDVLQVVNGVIRR